MDAIPYQKQKIVCTPSFADPSPHVWRPMMPVYVFGFGRRLPTVALVDTGAVETVIPTDFWEPVDPAYRQGEVGELSGADASIFEVKYGTVDLAVRLGNVIRNRSVPFWHEICVVEFGGYEEHRHLIRDFKSEISDGN